MRAYSQGVIGVRPHGMQAIYGAIDGIFSPYTMGQRSVRLVCLCEQTSSWEKPSIEVDTESYRPNHQSQHHVGGSIVRNCYYNSLFYAKINHFCP